MAEKPKVTAMETWKTGISQAFWYYKLDENDKELFKPVELGKGDSFYDNKSGENQTLSWFDKLFLGGIQIPNTEQKPITLLLIGPPGSGKSTLALELCYRWTKDKLMKCGYITTETTAKQIKQKIDKLGWTDEFQTYEDAKAPQPRSYYNKPRVVILGREWIGAKRNFSKILTYFFKIIPWADLASKIPVIGFLIAGIIKNLDKQHSAVQDDSNNGDENNKKRTFADASKDIDTNVIVIDSLNNIPNKKSQEKQFEAIIKATSKKQVKLLVFICDSDSESSGHKYWEYVSDYVISLAAESVEGYYLRTIEIIKSRFGENVLGRQIFKINNKLNEEVYKNKPGHYHPYRKEGGIFIYPSLHYYLSVYKKKDNKKKDDQEEKPQENDNPFVPTYPKEINNLIERKDENGLYPKGRCTAFIGERGGHKSHLGYLHILHSIINNKESGIIISLRDDEDMTEIALKTILSQEDILREKANEILFSSEEEREFSQDPETNSKEIVEEFKNRGVLEILYYHPGYISPEEFTHRMLMSILRIKAHSNEGSKKIKKGRFTNINLLFNSLDQLAPRFPLCARLNVFIPGIVDILNGEKVTSLFVAVDTPDQPVEQYGILPMADMVLSFQHKTFKEKEYLSLIKKEENGEANEKNHEAVIVEVTRSAGGERAGAIGILELVSEKEGGLYDLYQKTGLQFTKVEK